MSRAFQQGARNALNAGFDGVEIHGANGYLLDQFLQDNSNHRTDEYGGEIANRATVLLEVIQAVIEVWGKEKVGVRLSPSSTFNDMHDSNKTSTFSYVGNALNQFNLAYLHIVEPRIQGNVTITDDGTGLGARFFRSILKVQLLQQVVMIVKAAKLYYKMVMPILLLMVVFFLLIQIYHYVLPSLNL